MTEIRPVLADDAASAAHCHLLCWREAYAGLVDPARLDALTGDPAGHVERWRGWIAAGSPTLVAVAGAEVVGFILAEEAREPGLDVGFQLKVINVHPGYWGTDVAQRLHDAAVGDRDAFLWVLRDNPRARGFYRRNGYVADGAERWDEDFGAGVVRLVRRTPR